MRKRPDLRHQRAQDRRDAFRGRVATGPDGTYGFRTIRPVPYPGRTPHIHVALAAPGRAPLVTQFYVAGEPIPPPGTAQVWLHELKLAGGSTLLLGAGFAIYWRARHRMHTSA